MKEKNVPQKNQFFSNNMTHSKTIWRTPRQKYNFHQWCANNTCISPPSLLNPLAHTTCHIRAGANQEPTAVRTTIPKIYASPPHRQKKTPLAPCRDLTGHNSPRRSDSCQKAPSFVKSGGLEAPFDNCELQSPRALSSVNRCASRGGNIFSPLCGASGQRMRGAREGGREEGGGSIENWSLEVWILIGGEVTRTWHTLGAGRELIELDVQVTWGIFSHFIHARFQNEQSFSFFNQWRTNTEIWARVKGKDKYLLFTSSFIL